MGNYNTDRNRHAQRILDHALENRPKLISARHHPACAGCHAEIGKDPGTERYAGVYYTSERFDPFWICLDCEGGW